MVIITNNKVSNSKTLQHIRNKLDLFERGVVSLHFKISKEEAGGNLLKLKLFFKFHNLKKNFPILQSYLLIILLNYYYCYVILTYLLM